MQNINTLQDLRGVFAKVLEIPVEAITPELSPQTNRAWDSMKNMELIIEVESHFGVRFSGADIVALSSLQGFCTVLEQEKFASLLPT